MKRTVVKIKDMDYFAESWRGRYCEILKYENNIYQIKNLENKTIAYSNGQEFEIDEKINEMKNV